MVNLFDALCEAYTDECLKALHDAEKEAKAMLESFKNETSDRAFLDLLSMTKSITNPGSAWSKPLFRKETIDRLEKKTAEFEAEASVRAMRKYAQTLEKSFVSYMMFDLFEKLDRELESAEFQQRSKKRRKV